MKDDAKRMPVLEAELARLERMTDAQIKRAGDAADKAQWKKLLDDAFPRTKGRRR